MFLCLLVFYVVFFFFECRLQCPLPILTLFQIKLDFHETKVKSQLASLNPLTHWCDSVCSHLTTIPFTQAECSLLNWQEGKAVEGFVPFRCPGRSDGCRRARKARPWSQSSVKGDNSCSWGCWLIGKSPAIKSPLSSWWQEKIPLSSMSPAI